MTPEMTLAKALSTPQISFEKTASTEDSEMQKAMEKLAWAEDVGRELAREHMEKVAVIPPLGGVAGALKTGVGKLMHGAITTGAGTRTAVGAGIGAAGGGLAGFTKDPGIDPATGQQRGRLGNMAAGAVGGAALGAGAGYGAKALATHIGSSGGKAGQYAGNAFKQELKRSGSVGGAQISHEMQAARLRSAHQRNVLQRQALGQGGNQAVDPRKVVGTGMPAAPTPAAPGKARGRGPGARTVSAGPTGW